MSFSISQEIKWYVVHPITKDTMLLGEKGTVQELLIQKGELPDPYYGKNEELFSWIEKYNWTFFAKFELSNEQIAEDFIEIIFPSIDTYAKVYIDNHFIGTTENAFHEHSFQIKDYVKVGENFIKIDFTSPINFHRESYNKRKSQLPAPNDVGEIAVASMSRKPQYQFGWDWALRMNTIGLWKPVKINSYSENKFNNLKYETKSISNNAAEIELYIKLKLKSKDDLFIQSELFGNSKLERNFDEFRFIYNLKNVKLWWPLDYGEQFIYTDIVKLYDKNNKLIDELKINFGVRTSELIQEKDSNGTSFYFKINGQKVFIKGTNYIPQDAIISRIKDSDIIKLLNIAKESNINLIRVWGGGYYPDEIFFETCDKLGIMVWQDFMFACSMYPGDNHFLNLIKQEAESVVLRISTHPSVIYFNGNNEVDVAWKNWGFQIRYLIGPKSQREIENAYNDIFKKILPQTVKNYCNLPYEHTSPLSNWGKDEYFKHGTMHYWGVWHGNDPIEDFGSKIGRFNAEYGFQSFPEFSTLKTVSDEKDWDLFSPVMKHHQKSYVGNGMIKKHSEILFGQTTDFKRFVYYSQLTQAKAVSIAISGHRLNAPICMGTIYWQFNDCWQAPTWSSVDYFYQWKCLQYQVKKDYEAVTVLQKTETIGKERYFILNEHNSSFNSELNIEIYDLKGNILYQDTENIFLSNDYKRELVSFLSEDEWINRDYLLKFSWKNHNSKNLNRNFFHASKNYTSETENTINIELVNIDEVNKKAQLIIKNKKFVADFWIYSTQIGINYSENFVNYLPGEHKIEIEFEKVPKVDDFNFMYR